MIWPVIATDSVPCVSIKKYQTALREKLSELRTAFEARIVGEFAPKWGQNPPRHFSRWGIEPTPQNIKAELARFAQEIFENAISFDDPKVKVLYKNVAPENIRDSAFLEVLKNNMVRRRVPQAIIASLFESGQAAPEIGAFMGR